MDDKEIPLKKTLPSWYQKRRISTIICICFNFIYGVDMTAVNVSLLYYLNDYFNEKSANMLYSFIIFISYTATIFAGFIGKIGDKTRNLKLIMFILLLIICIGNLCYSLYFSIWFLIVGRFLVGFGNPLRSVMSGELSRWYTNPKERSTVIIYCGFAFSFGFMVGPATAATFVYVNLSIGSWHINKDNCIGVVMAFLAMILMVATVFGVHNLTKKDIPKRNKNDEQEIVEIMNFSLTNQERSKYTTGDSVDQDVSDSKGDAEKSNKQSSSCDSNSFSFKDILKDTEVMLIIAANAWLFFVAGTNELVIVLVARNTLKMDLKILTISIFISFVLYMIFMFTCWRRFFSGTNSLLGILFCLWCGCFSPSVLVFVTHVEINSTFVKSALIAFSSLTTVVSSVPVTLAVQEILFQIVPKHSASFVDGVRTGFSNGCGVALGALSASSIYAGLFYGSVMIIFVLLMLVTALYLRRSIIYERMICFQNS